jgi:hypothetical protein
MKFGLSVPVQHPPVERASRVSRFPDDCIRQIRTHQEQLGITHMKFRVHWAGMPHELVMRTIRLLGEKVLPACR